MKRVLVTGANSYIGESFATWVKKKYPNKVYVMTIKDEDEIFEIADSYRDAIEEHTIKQYWKTF